MSKLTTLPILFLSLCLTAFGQVTSSELSGSVVDPSGAALVNAKVVATNAGTGLIHQTVTNGTGNYLIPLLQPGDYTISAEAPGFKKPPKRALPSKSTSKPRLTSNWKSGRSPMPWK